MLGPDFRDNDESKRDFELYWWEAEMSKTSPPLEYFFQVIPPMLPTRILPFSQSTVGARGFISSRSFLKSSKSQMTSIRTFSLFRSTWAGVSPLSFSAFSNSLGLTAGPFAGVMVDHERCRGFEHCTSAQKTLPAPVPTFGHSPRADLGASLVKYSLARGDYPSCRPRPIRNLTPRWRR
jgi:hypothetical protein